MGLRELKNQILSEIKRIEGIFSKVQEIESSEIYETELEKDEIKTSESVQRIESEEEVKQEIEPSEFNEPQLEKDESESLEMIQEIELVDDKEERIKTSENGEAKLEKDKPETLEFDLKIKFVKDAKQILKNIVHHLEEESSLKQADLRRTSPPSKDISNLYNELDVKVISEKSTIKEYKKNDIPIKLKSKFGVIRKLSVKDKLK